MYHLPFSLTVLVADMSSSGKALLNTVTESDKMEDAPVEGACGLQSLDSLSSSSDPDDLIVCGICEELYDDNTHQPKFLSCFHTFCVHCLNKLDKKEPAKSAIIQCPNCRSSTQLSENRVSGLQTNFYIHRMKNMSRNIEQCRTVGNHCHKHINQVKSYLCITCGITICHDCVIMDHTAETGHAIISISNEDVSYLQELNVSHETLLLNKKNLRLIESELSLLTAAKETAIKDLESFIKLANKQLEQRKNDLRNQILDIFNTQRDTLLEKQNQIQEATKILNKNITKSKTMTKTGDLGKLRSINESLKKVNENMLSDFSKLDLGDNYLELKADDGINELERFLCTLGKIHSKGLLPTKITFKSTEATAGLKATLTAEVYDHRGDKMTVPVSLLSIQITDPVGTELPTHLAITGTQCTVTFRPQMNGLHQVVATFMGQRLMSGQTHFSVRSNNPVLKFGKHGKGKGTFGSPWTIAIDSNACLYVVDNVNKLIQKFTAEGNFLSQFSVAVHNKDHTTCDIALDLNKGWIVCPETSVTNTGLTGVNNILVFNLEGELLNTYALTDTKCAFYIAMNTHGDIITSDILKKNLHKVDGGGTFLCHIQRINSPGYMSINDDDSIIVPDRTADCIYTLNPDGSVRHRFGSSGTGKGQLKKPCGIAGDGEYILVTEEGNNRIQVFRNDGTFVSMIGNEEDPPLKPRGMAVTRDGHVYVVDWGNHCVKKYRYKDVA